MAPPIKSNLLKSDLEVFRKEIESFDPSRDLTTQYASDWIEKN